MSSAGDSKGGKPRRTAPATMPGAVSVPATLEPERETVAAAAASASSRVPAPPQSETPEKTRRTVKATMPGAVAVANEEPDGTVSPSATGVRSSLTGKARRTTPPATMPGAVPVASQQVQHVAHEKARRTTAPATTPGAVSVSAEEPEPMVVTRTSAATTSKAPASSVASSVGTGKSRTMAPATTPGVVRVAAQEPEPAMQAFAGDGKRRTSAPATRPGAMPVTVQGPDQEEVVLTAGATSTSGGGSFRAVEGEKVRRSTRAVAPGAVQVTAATQTAKSASVEKGQMELNTATVQHQVSGVDEGMEGVMRVVEDDLAVKKSSAGHHSAATVPGAVPVASREAQDSVALQKDPRSRRGGRRGEKAKAAVSGGAAAAVTISAANSAQDDAEYRRRLENKVKEAEREHLGVNDTSSAFDDPAKAPFEDPKAPFDDVMERKRPMAIDPEKTPGGSVDEPAAGIHMGERETIATGARGVAVAPELEYGTTRYGGPGFGGSDDDALAVAIAISEEDDDNFLFPAAVEYDPDAKPPLMKNRRFRMYAISALVLFVSIVVIVIVGVVVFRTDSGELTLAPTMAPSAAPTTGVYGKYLEAFEKVAPLVTVKGSMQERAATWIMDEDPLALNEEAPNLVQRYLLALFYFVTTNDGENPWRSCNAPRPGENETCVYQEFTRLLNDSIAYVPKESFRWLSGVHECQWVGNLCDDIEVTRALDLLGQNITGTLPTELASFSFLQSIALAYNEFTGTLPSIYATDMRHLLNLEVHGNSLTGTFPPEYYSATNLQNLNIGDNIFTGTLSTEIGRLTNLKGFQTFSNFLTGTFPTEISKLEFLSFSRNHDNIYTGTIPTEIGRLVLLQELWLNENQFSGTIPTEVAAMTDMAEFRVHLNNLVGTIPEGIYDFSFLIRLDLFSNYLTGTLSTRVGSLPDLRELRVSRNKLTGTIPVEIANMQSLELAWLHSNLFGGSLPTEICALRPRLQFLQTDCFPDGSAPNPCDCCTACCDRTTEICLVIDDNL